MKTGVEEYYCPECEEEFGKRDIEVGEHEGHDGFRKITIFQGWVLDLIRKDAEAQRVREKTLAQSLELLQQVHGFLEWWYDLRAGSSIEFDVETFRSKLAKWLEASKTTGADER